MSQIRGRIATLGGGPSLFSNFGVQDRVRFRRPDQAQRSSGKRQMSADGAADLRRRAAPSVRTRHDGEARRVGQAADKPRRPTVLKLHTWWAGTRVARWSHPTRTETISPSDRCPPTERRTYVGEPLRRLAPDTAAKPLMWRKKHLPERRCAWSGLPLHGVVRIGYCGTGVGWIFDAASSMAFFCAAIAFSCCSCMRFLMPS